MKLSHRTFIFLLILLLSFNIFCQQSERDRGIAFYKKGSNNSEAIRILETVSKQNETKKDGEVWNYLGLAYIRADKIREARKALEKAVRFSPQDPITHSNLAYAYLLTRKTDKAQSETNKSLQLNPRNANAYFVRGTAYLWEGKYEKAISDAEQAISNNAQMTSAYVLKSDGLLYSFGKTWQKGDEPAEHLEFLRQAKNVLESCQKNCPQDREITLVNERAETVTDFLDYFSRPKKSFDKNLSQTDPDNKPITILSKRPARYTDTARQAGISGTVTTAVLFGADGKIKHILMLKGIGYGLDEEALAAAQEITFQPQIEDGKAVSVIRQVQYSFTIY